MASTTLEATYYAVRSLHLLGTISKANQEGLIRFLNQSITEDIHSAYLAIASVALTTKYVDRFD